MKHCFFFHAYNFLFQGFRTCICAWPSPYERAASTPSVYRGTCTVACCLLSPALVSLEKCDEMGTFFSTRCKLALHHGYGRLSYAFLPLIQLWSNVVTYWNSYSWPKAGTIHTHTDVCLKWDFAIRRAHLNSFPSGRRAGFGCLQFSKVFLWPERVWPCCILLARLQKSEGILPLHVLQISGKIMRFNCAYVYRTVPATEFGIKCSISVQSVKNSFCFEWSSL